ncbi:hypothetical protein B0H16DRAFT_1772867 [Mycena metata]|uniref:Uncharacterized protein n=1 Tax=Mycena metata TaxID=1033252 RepID=A0AAD7H7L8_9AGAR|nr:hypothetical protein B0H16DRAFT_1899120 [Mycena metata]KAJ7731527.1 hypothetical protein B0H16DRAFT_1772867 [Mycena metata]
MSNTQLHVPGWLDAHIPDIALAFNTTGIVLTALLLLAVAYAAWNPVSRLHLNRVSFRLLVCALISNLIFAATSIPTFSGPSAGCSFMAFLGLGILMFSSCMFFCTALNLQLVLVYHINGNSMEKFYYIGSVAVVAILNITPYAAGQFGYYFGTCWFNNPLPDVQFRWLVGSQSVWILLMSTGEVMRNPRGMSTSSTSFSIPPSPAIVVYRSIILRIGLYPLLSCCLSFTGCILDIWLTKNTEPTELQFRLSFLDLCVFALRPTLYTLLAAMDPGFLRALRALRNHSKSKHSTGPTSSNEHTSAESHELQFCSNNSRAPVHVQLEREQKPTTWGAESNKSRVEQSSAPLKSLETQSVMSQGGAVGARRKPSFVEQEPVQSVISLAEREREEGEELEAQTRSLAEDIARQI